MWLLHTEETDGVQIMHCRNEREYRLPELPNYSVDRYCLETNTIYEFLAVLARAYMPTIPGCRHTEW